MPHVGDVGEGRERMIKALRKNVGTVKNKRDRIVEQETKDSRDGIATYKDKK